MMTEIQIEVIRGLADNGMKVSATATALGKKAATIHSHIHEIKNRTGKDPMCFYDLNALLTMAKRQKGKKAVYVCTCKVCGAKFESHDHHFRLCSDECRAVASGKSKSKSNATKAGYMREYRRHMSALNGYEPTKPAPTMTLAEACKRAREKGMTYGEYMTWLRECAK